MTATHVRPSSQAFAGRRRASFVSRSAFQPTPVPVRKIGLVVTVKWLCPFQPETCPPSGRLWRFRRTIRPGRERFPGSPQVWRPVPVRADAATAISARPDKYMPSSTPRTGVWLRSFRLRLRLSVCPGVPPRRASEIWPSRPRVQAMAGAARRARRNNQSCKSPPSSVHGRKFASTPIDGDCGLWTWHCGPIFTR